MRWAAKPQVVVVVVSLAVLAVLGGVARADVKAVTPRYDVEVIKDVSYYEGPDAHKTKHRLDLYLPRDCSNFPILFFVHGGGWRHGDKNFLGIYASLGRYWAERGVGSVVTNYRLSPAVKHPDHVKDVARAFAWTARNIAHYRGEEPRLSERSLDQACHAYFVL